MKCLVIGGNGFLGYSVVEYLARENEVICFSKDECLKEELIPGVKYVIGDIWDESLLNVSLEGVDVVLDFISTTMPNSKNIYLDDEINRTLRYHNYIMTAIHRAGIKHYIFPSSGGAIYGNTDGLKVKEDRILEPCTTYGVGKKMVEDMLHYFNQKLGIAVTILRIGNIYGSKLKRNIAQGVVDILIQVALQGGSFTTWGNALKSKRDYVFLEDVAEAVSIVINNYKEGELRVFNIGSGETKSLEEVIRIVEKVTDKSINLISDNSKASGVNQIALSIDKIQKEVGWVPKTSLEEGIRKTVQYKKRFFKN